MLNPTRIAIVGFGLVGKRHAAVVQHSPNLELAGIVEPNSGSIENVSDTPVFATLEDLFEHVKVDGVVLATPTPLHLEQGMLCIANTCPILVEKPIAVTAQEAQQLNTAANAAGIPILVGHHRRHNGMVAAAKQAIDKGDIGNVRAVQATCWFYKPDSYFETAPWRKKKGAGPISVNLVHDIDLLRHFCGEVSNVHAVAAPSLRGYENEDLATAILTFASGTIATISVSDSIVAPWSWELTSRENPIYPPTSESCYLIGGSRGGMSLPDLRIWRHEDPDWWSPISAENLRYLSDDPLHIQMNHFADVIQGKAQPLVSGYEGMRSLEVVEAISKSAAESREITIPAG